MIAPHSRVIVDGYRAEILSTFTDTYGWCGPKKAVYCECLMLEGPLKGLKLDYTKIKVP